MNDPCASTDHDLSGTAMYTAGVWSWYGVPGAELLASKESKAAFHFVNAMVRVQHLERRGSPSLPHSLVQRHQLITHLVEMERHGCVIELASGFAPRGITLSARPDIEYVEVDRPAVVRRKRELLERSADGRAALSRSNFRLVDGDALSVDLADLVVGDPTSVVVIFEGLTPYLDDIEQRKLFAHLGAQASQFDGLRILFDHVPWTEQPPPGPVGRKLSRWFEEASGSQGFRRDERSRADILDELDQAGFADARVHDPNEVPAHWRVPRWPDKRTQMLVFDASTVAT